MNFIGFSLISKNKHEILACDFFHISVDFTGSGSKSVFRAYPQDSGNDLIFLTIILLAFFECMPDLTIIGPWNSEDKFY
jgi:hypothetical protein